MATLTVSNQFKYEKGIGAVNFSTDSFYIALMASGFTFDPDNHGTWADVSASEISTAGGYTAGGEVLSTDFAWAQVNAENKASISWLNHTFTASGGPFDPISGAIVYDFSHGSNLIVGAVIFDADVTVSDGNSLQLQNLGYDDV